MLGYQCRTLPTHSGSRELTTPDEPYLPGSTPIGNAGHPAWAALKAAARWCREEGGGRAAIAPAQNGEMRVVDFEAPVALCRYTPQDGWTLGPAALGQQAALLDLYLPLCAVRTGAPLTVGHLGQSLDGYIATESGDSYYVTGPANLRHLHRMRALCDAVLVGAETVANDDPQLTTRLAEGDNAVRVVIDPKRRLGDRFRVFQDGAAPTVLVCDVQYTGGQDALGRASVVGVPTERGKLRLDLLLASLRASGIQAVFVEGGGATVSSFLEAGLLDRVQVAIAPLITGLGRPGLRLPGRQRLGDALRPAHRVFRMGQDVLFDCDLRGPPRGADEGDPVELARVI